MHGQRQPRQQKKSSPAIGVTVSALCLLFLFTDRLVTNIGAASAFQSTGGGLRQPLFQNSRSVFSFTTKHPPYRPWSSQYKYLVATPSTSQQRQYNSSTQPRARSWEGDDVRWIQKIKRRIYRQSQGGWVTPARTTLIVLNILAFIYQSLNTIHYIRLRNPQYWPSQAGVIVADTVMGSAIRGPFTSDFVHSNFLSARQPHRFLTAGFLHADLLHLFLNMDALRRIPSWLETGLGWPLFVTAFLVSIVTGNIGHTISAYQDFDRTFCLGASGAICGLYGLMYVALVKMGKPQQSMQVLRGMLFLILYGILLQSVSNAAHVGGFLGGVVVAILCAPSYRKDYGMRRKNSLRVDLWPRDYRAMMGFGINPSKRGILPVAALWLIALLGLATNAKYRAIPRAIFRGLLHPGSLTRLSFNY